MSQESRIQEYLEAGNCMTNLDALRLFDCMAASQRCTALRKKGVPIVTDMIDTPSGKRIASWRLKVPFEDAK